MASKIGSRKAKGRRLQDFVRDIFRDIFRDKLEPDDISSRQMGGAGVDVVLTPASKKLIPFDIEAKNQEKVSIPAALRQANNNTIEGRIPLVVFSKNRDDVYVALKFTDFIKLVYPTWEPNIEIKGKNVLPKKELLQDSTKI